MRGEAQRLQVEIEAVARREVGLRATGHRARAAIGSRPDGRPRRVRSARDAGPRPRSRARERPASIGTGSTPRGRLPRRRPSGCVRRSPSSSASGTTLTSSTGPRPIGSGPRWIGSGPRPIGSGRVAVGSESRPIGDGPRPIGSGPRWIGSGPRRISNDREASCSATRGPGPRSPPPRTRRGVEGGTRPGRIAATGAGRLEASSGDAGHPGQHRHPIPRDLSGRADGRGSRRHLGIHELRGADYPGRPRFAGADKLPSPQGGIHEEAGHRRGDDPGPGSRHARPGPARGGGPHRRRRDPRPRTPPRPGRPTSRGPIRPICMPGSRGSAPRSRSSSSSTTWPGSSSPPA